MYPFVFAAGAVTAYFVVAALRRPRPAEILALVLWAAYAVYEMVSENMASAARVHAVERGAVVMLLEGEDVRAAVKTAQDQLAQAAEQLAVGETLSAKGSLPETQLTARRAAKSAAEGALSQAQAAADRLSLVAPFAGTVDAVNVEEGEWVQQGTPIATLIALDPIIVKAEVAERDVAHVAVGAKALVRLVSGVELEGTVKHLARKASDKTRTFALEVDLPNPNGAIPSGMTAELRLTAATQPAQVLDTPRPRRVARRRIAGRPAHACRYRPRVFLSAALLRSPSPAAGLASVSRRLPAPLADRQGPCVCRFRARRVCWKWRGAARREALAAADRGGCRIGKVRFPFRRPGIGRQINPCRHPMAAQNSTGSPADPFLAF